MKTARRAVIDVGTNSVKLLVADVVGGVVQPVLEDSEQTRLGAGFFETRRLQAGPISHTAQAVAGFTARARELKAESVRVIATSAARDALNSTDLADAIISASGLGVEIISGDQEADWAFQGVTTDPALTKQPLVLMDLGGGSTEFIVGEGGHKNFRQSFQLGTVRLLESMPPSDPPAPAQFNACGKFVRDFLEREVRPQLAPALAGLSGANAARLVGVGGTATILARMEAGLESYDRGVIEGMRITVAQIKSRSEQMWSLPLAERKLIPGLPKTRADVALFGVLVYQCVMECFGFSELRVSTRGLRFAAVM